MAINETIEKLVADGIRLVTGTESISSTASAWITTGLTKIVAVLGANIASAQVTSALGCQALPLMSTDGNDYGRLRIPSVVNAGSGDFTVNWAVIGYKTS